DPCNRLRRQSPRERAGPDLAVVALTPAHDVARRADSATVFAASRDFDGIGEAVDGDGNVPTRAATVAESAVPAEAPTDGLTGLARCAGVGLTSADPHRIDETEYGRGRGQVRASAVAEHASGSPAHRLAIRPHGAGVL